MVSGVVPMISSAVSFRFLPKGFIDLRNSEKVLSPACVTGAALPHTCRFCAACACALATHVPAAEATEAIEADLPSAPPAPGSLPAAPPASGEQLSGALST